MYRITTPTGETHLTEKVTYVRQHSSGVFLITDQKRAEGVGYQGNFYLFSDGVQVHEVDGGAYFFSNQEDMKSQLQQADDTAIELYEAHMAQEEINTAQDDALIEIYERLEA